MTACLRNQDDFDLLALGTKSTKSIGFKDDSLDILDSSFLPPNSSGKTEHILVSRDFPNRIHEVSRGLSSFLEFKKGELLHSTIRVISGPNTNVEHLKHLVDSAMGSCPTKEAPCEAAISLYKKNGEEFRRTLRG